MKYNIFESIYDDEENSKAAKFFVKMRKWIDNARNSEALSQIKKIFMQNPFAKSCLVEGSNSAGAFEDGLLLESSGFARSLFGKEKSSMEAQFDEALNENYQRPESEDETGYEAVYQFTEKGIELTPHSKLDEKAYWSGQKKEKNLEEDWTSLSIEEKFKEAMS